LCFIFSALNLKLEIRNLRIMNHEYKELTTNDKPHA